MLLIFIIDTFGCLNEIYSPSVPLNGRVRHLHTISSQSLNYEVGISKCFVLCVKNTTNAHESSVVLEGIICWCF